MSTVLPVPEISGLDAAFPADALSWMPPWDEIPPEFRDMNRGTEWNRIVRQWFFSGLPATTKFKAKKGIDERAALRAISATMGSWAPKHEHKEAATAYMLSCWFESVKGWEKRKGRKGKSA
ncbi:MAG: hypothetical protein NUW01_17215 [Gemmatimonadaceae bacterium]|nr:hypothetical protein [Gemmatimonadaceae bacterium]